MGGMGGKLKDFAKRNPPETLYIFKEYIYIVYYMALLLKGKFKKSDL